MSVPLEEVLFRCEPRGEPSPLVVEVPRSGSLYPRDFRAVAPFDVVHSAVSMYVDELFAGTPAAGGTLLVARFPNTYIDANRGLDDLDPDMIEGVWLQPLAQTQKKSLGVGLVRKLAKPGVPMYDRKLTVAEIEHRIHHYHEPYHQALAETLDAQRRRFGSAFHVSCHCMNNIAGPQTPDIGKARPDFCIGDQDGKTSGREFVEFVVESLRGRGFKVAVNDPYKGAECVRRHGAPGQGIHSLQIETNKKLFMDEKTFLRNEGFRRLEEEINRLLAAVAGFARRHARQLG